jgi:2-octaprenyl-6-methoxyphenol hydroxylase
MRANPTDIPARAARVRILGTGPVSLLLRGLLLRQGFEPGQLVCDPPPAELPAWLGQRAIALSLGSWQLLARVAALPASAPIRSVEIGLRGAAGRTRLHAEELGEPAVGHVVRYQALHRALLEAIAAPAVPALPALPAEPLAPADVTVLADGNPGEDSALRDFAQTALLASVRVSRPVEGMAFERFTSEGPLALLPLPGDRCWSLVWCAPTAHSQARAELPRAQLEQQLERAFGPALGKLSISDSPVLAPLERRLRRSTVRGSEIAIGNAAQALHPVAGQGMNLGFRDAFVLAERLGAAQASGLPLSSAAAPFERHRRLDRLATVAVTDTLATIFTQPLLHPLQSLALGLLDLAGPARRTVARAFMFGLR